MRTLARITAAAAILTVAATAAQQKPNFSGRWVIVSPAEGAGQEQLVTHDEKTLTTEHSSERANHKMIYQLDGVERRMAVASRGGEIAMLAKAAWEGDRIIVTTNTTYPNGMKTQSREVWSLDAQGRLVIDYTETGPTGAGPSMKVIHVKKP